MHQITNILCYYAVRNLLQVKIGLWRNAKKSHRKRQLSCDHIKWCGKCENSEITFVVAVIQFASLPFNGPYYISWLILTIYLPSSLESNYNFSVAVVVDDMI